MDRIFVSGHHAAVRLHPPKVDSEVISVRLNYKDGFSLDGGDRFRFCYGFSLDGSGDRFRFCYVFSLDDSGDRFRNWVRQPDMRPVAEVYSLILGQLDLEAAAVLEAVDDLTCKAIGFFSGIFLGDCSLR